MATYCFNTSNPNIDGSDGIADHSTKAINSETNAAVVRGENGKQSQWRGTLMGYLLQLDRKMEAVHQKMLPNVMTAIQKLFKKEKEEQENG